MRIFTSRSFSDTGVPSVCLWREGLPIQGPALRPGLGAENVHKMHGCCTGPFEAPGHSCAELSGRLAHSGSLQGASKSSQGYRSLPHHSLGLRLNAKKSVLLPSQQTVFLGIRLDSIQMQASLALARISNFTACLARFKLAHHVSVGTCRRLLGLMASASPVLPLGLLSFGGWRSWGYTPLYQPLALSGCRAVALDPFYYGGTPLFSRAGWEWVRSTIAIWSWRTHHW